MLKKLVNRIRRWFFLTVFFVCGILYLTCVDGWQVYARSVESIQAWVQKQEGQRESQKDVEAGENYFFKGEKKDGEAQEKNREEKQKTTVSGGDIGQEDTSVSGGDIKDPSVGDVPAEAVYRTVEDEYFADAVFIGDSRTVGMYEYGGLEDISTFYASTGLSVYKLFNEAIAEVPDRKKKVTVEEALSQRQFAKIYLMLGINEMGTGSLEDFLDRYKEAVERLQELQPDAIIYIQGIMKVTTERSSRGDYINNEGIEERNKGLSELADNQKIFYLDVNPMICDETGGLESSYTSDGVHLKAQYILIWKDFLKTHAVETFSGGAARENGTAEEGQSGAETGEGM